MKHRKSHLICHRLGTEFPRIEGNGTDRDVVFENFTWPLAMGMVWRCAMASSGKPDIPCLSPGDLIHLMILMVGTIFSSSKVPENDLKC